MRIFVTGPTGALGIPLCNFLRNKGETVYELKSDILYYYGLDREIKKFKPDIILHLAACVSTVSCNKAPKKAILTNILGTYNIVKILNEMKTRPLLVYFATTASFDVGLKKITESSKMNPQTLYGITKCAGEYVARNLYKNTLIVRNCFVYSEYDDISPSKAIKYLIYCALNNKKCELNLNPEFLKDYIHVSDSNEFLYRLIKKKCNDEYNISNGNPMKFEKIVEIIKSYGLKLKIKFNAESDYLGNHIVSNEKVVIETKYKPKIDIKTGIGLMIKELKKEMRK